jgi:hypothetical protein
VRLATDAHRAGDREAAPALVEQARKRLQDPPAGSKWETPWWEPSEIKVWVYGPCGIGTVNARSVRFLQFYTA